MIDDKNLREGERKLVEHAIERLERGSLTSVTRVADSSFHQVYRCRLTDGVVALKRLTDRPDLPGWRRRFEDSYRVERFLASSFKFLPTPLLFDGERGLCRVEISRSEAVTFIAHDWIHGRKLTGRREDSRILFEVGLAIRQVAVTPKDLLSDRNGMDDGPTRPEHMIVSLQALGNLVGGIDDALDIIAGRLDGLEIVFDAEDLRPTVVGHRDLSRENIVIGSDGEVFVVDWENVGPTTIESELGTVIVHWIAGRDNMELRVERFLDEWPYAYRLDGRKPVTWFSRWLRGHLMFLMFLVQKIGSGAESSRLVLRIRREVRKLADFARSSEALCASLSRAVMSRK